MSKPTFYLKKFGVDFFSVCNAEQIGGLVVDTTNYEHKSQVLHNGTEVGAFIPKMVEGLEFEVSEKELKTLSPQLYAILKNPEKNNVIGQGTINNPSGITEIFNNIICSKGLQTVSNNSVFNKVTLKLNR